ncbi:MAG TPA: Yip1 family protein [Steroidobacteraceae bacterium]
MSVVPDSSATVSPVAPVPRTKSGLFGRMKGMLFAPSAEWMLIATDVTPTARLYTSYIVPLALLDALVGFIHVTSGAAHVPFSGGVITALLVFAFGLLGIFLVALIINAVAPFFGAVGNRRLAAAIAVYASTPIWLATVFVPFPTLWAPLQVLAVTYHTWLLYLGLRQLMKAPRDRVLGYATTVVLCTILLEIVFAIASTALGGATHLNPYRALG